jgi:predicted dithiol-disulfide oxidoreductase (DUF899 family)
MARELQTPHDFRFPGESDEYRRARNDLLNAEVDLRRQTERVAALRRKLPLGGAVGTDYAFEEWDEAVGAGRPLHLSELFEDGKDTLFVYSFMVVPREQGLPFVGPCPSCTSIIDGIDGAIPHITRRMSFAVESAAPIAQFREHGSARGWRHARLLSSAGNSYREDYGAADASGYQWPLATLFVRRDGGVHHYWSSELWWVTHDGGEGPRHVDFMWPMWAVFDRAPDGRDEWEPKLQYG